MVGVSAERDELRRLVEELPDAEVPAAVADLRLRLAPPADRPWPPPWFGAATGSRTDTAVRSEELLKDGFSRPA
jgi:hypothetical protein